MAEPLPRVSEVTKRVLLLIVESQHSEFYGRDLAKRSGLQFGTVYGILERLEKYGWLEGSWEEAKASKLSRPQRRYYRLTNSGFNLAQRLLMDRATYSGSVGRPFCKQIQEFKLYSGQVSRGCWRVL